MPASGELRRTMAPRNLDELIELLVAAHERFDRLERRLDVLTVAVRTLGIDVDLPAPRFADAEGAGR